MADSAHGGEAAVPAADGMTSPAEGPDGMVAAAAAVPLPEEVDPWQQGADPWGINVAPHGKGPGSGKGTESGSVSQTNSPGGKKGKGKGGGKGEKGAPKAKAVPAPSTPIEAPPQSVPVQPSSMPSSTIDPSLQPPPVQTPVNSMPAAPMSAMGNGMTTPWGQPFTYGPNYGHLPFGTVRAPPQAPIPQGLFGPPQAGPCLPGGHPQWMMHGYPMAWPTPPMVMPSQDGSAGSWSKPTEETHQGGKNHNKKSKKKAPPSDPEGPSEPPGTDEDLDDASQRSSTAATSEIKSMLKRRMKQEDGYRPKSSLGSMKVEEFYGDRTRYLKWKRTIQAQQHLYALESNELAMLVYLSTRREARDVVEQNPIQAYTEAGSSWRTTVVVEGVGRSLRRERCRALRTCGQGVGTLQTPAWRNNRPLSVRENAMMCSMLLGLVFRAPPLRRP